ncbi:DUF2680 domain-containing protein [Heliobacterium chlorum]|uniref:DUF2680 domain-containing protein n=1 Tax=Heliobacterium chlorum TaxID=2698 RepID=A0ABR7T680_HELCL|nr:DUF2680 domain-containing protein [Heliobacterium chlorum]MBC9785171.1 DUF2680 domain-containing protein [Heliobacterium chlorum]
MSKKWTKGMVSVGLIGALFCGGIVAYAATDTTTSSNGQGTSFSHHFGFKGEKGNFAGRGHGAFQGGPFEKHLEDLATIFSMDKDALKTELQSGKTMLEIAQAKGISKDDLIAKMVTDAENRIDKAVKDGKVTSDKATQMKANLKDRITAAVERKADPSKANGKRGMIGNHFQKVTEILNMQPNELKDEMKAGKSLAEIAQSQGIAPEDLKAKMIEAAKQNIDSLVQQGKMTQEKADQVKQGLEKRIDGMINHKPGMHEGTKTQLAQPVQ